MDSVLLDADLKLDVIDVSEGDADYLPFTTHRFAFDTRSPVEIVVQPTDDAPRSATIDVARASALVAVKLGISEGVGRQRDTWKVGSDAFDVVRLLQRFGPDALADELLALGGSDFVERVSDLAQRHLIEDADRTTAAITRSSVQGVQSIGADQLDLLGTRVHATTRSQLSPGLVVQRRWKAPLPTTRWWRGWATIWM